jgi:FlaG/FlaF family flagellin (archaellin)
MRARTCRPGDDAVSPVIGVVLLFAISVALAAVTAGVVIGAEEGLITTAPQASFAFDYEPGTSSGEDISSSSSSEYGALTMTHAGGDTIDASNLEVRAQPGGSADEGELGWSGDLAAGSSATVTVDDDATVRLVHATDGGSTTVATWRGSEA